MAIKTTTWWPDTCSCCHQYTWDDSTTEDQRVHTFSGTVVMCPIHSHPIPKSSFDNCMADNQKKNQAVNAVVESLSLTPDKVSFKLNSDRTISVDVPGASALQITQVQSALAVKGVVGVSVTNLDVGQAVKLK